MKLRLLISLLVIISSTVANAQTDTTNVSEINVTIKSKPDYHLKSGFYKTYQEFLDNSPSEIRGFTLIQKTKAQERLDRGICAVNFDIAEGEEKVGKVWGFSDGNAVYFKFSPMEGKYWKLLYVGPNSFFIHVSQARSIGSLIASAFIPLELCFINQKGKATAATNNALKKLFSPQPDLKNDFENDKDKSDERKKYYLIKFNELQAK